MTSSSIEILKNDLEKLLETCPKELQSEWKQNFDGFLNLFENYKNEVKLDWDKIVLPDEKTIVEYNTLENVQPSKDMLDKLVVIKLNGGLATTMGCVGPKSLISLRNDMTFLDITILQLEILNKKYNTSIPLVLMNSFNTEAETQKTLYKYKSFKTPCYCFMQNQCPRIDQESLRPIADKVEISNNEWWYPPGHGNFYYSFYNSGLLDKLLSQGKTISFVSNIDNLGATIDFNILNLAISKEGNIHRDFIIEVTDKTKSDIKGGTIIEYEGKATLLELAQVPKNHVEDFKSVSKFKIFNTNNLWIRLEAIKKLIIENKMNLDIIVNRKCLENGRNIIQLETAIGAAIKNFNCAIGVNVPRYRFLPVKNNSDLFLIKSNLYSLTDGTLKMNDKRQFKTTPYVNFSGEYFKKVSDFLSRFESIPDIVELDHLTVSGDVTFGSNVTLRGTVIIISHHGERIDIPSGAILENKIVSGNLRIVSH